ncbi:hypothetical protein ACRAWG_12355 [Methylobacterium sp. P31]
MSVIPAAWSLVEGGDAFARVDDDEPDRRDLHADQVPGVVPVGLGGHDEAVDRRCEADAHTRLL